MAKYNEHSTDPRFTCQHCGGRHDVQIAQDGTSYGALRTITIVKVCQCGMTTPQYINTNSISTNSTRKEAPVAKQFDTTETKSLMLNTIVSKVEAMERALYNRVEARAKLESMHTQHIADASTALDRVMAEAFQKGLREEDLENHLPDYEQFLSERLTSVAIEMSLANVLEGV